MTQHPPNESDIPINSRLEIFFRWYQNCSAVDSADVIRCV